MSETDREDTLNEESLRNDSPMHSRDRHSPSNVWPVILIAVGVIFLLRNFDLVSTRVLANIFKLWPLILVYLGLDYWTRHNPRIRTIVTILFISGVVFAILLLSDQSAAFWHS